jgi:hypothetical protein
MGTSTPGSWPPADREQDSPTGGADRRITWAIVLTISLMIAATTCLLVTPDTVSSSGNGCVTVMIASSTGGAIEHECGEKARVLCRSAYASDDKLSRLTRPQCVLAGLGPG